MLQQLTIEQASNCPFPVGSSVWYEAEPEDQRLSAGTVQSISLDFESRRFHYEVNRDAVDEQRVRCFGDGCPIYVRCDEREVEGIVLYGKNGKKEDEKASYTVKLFEGDNRFSTEEGVSADRIRFRAMDTQPCEPGIPETVSLKTHNVSAGEALASKDLPLHETLQEEKGEAPLTPNEKLQSELDQHSKQRQGSEEDDEAKAKAESEAEKDDSPLTPRGKLRRELDRRANKRRQERQGPSTRGPSSNEADDEVTANTESAAENTTIRVSSNGSELESVLTDDRSILSVSTRDNNSSMMLAGNKRGRSEKESGVNPKPKKADKIRLAIPNWLTTQDGARQQRLLQHLTTTFQGLPVEIKGRGEEMYLTSTATDLVLINETLQKSIVRFIDTDCSTQNGNASASRQTESIALQQKAIQARCIARNVALGHLRTEELLSSMDELLVAIQTAAPGPLKQAAVQFRAKILWWVDKPGRRHPTLAACDSLRDFLRAQGVDVR